MKKILSIALAAVAVAALAQEAPNTDSATDKAAERKAKIEAAMAKAGGLVDQAGTGAAIEIVDTRKTRDGSVERVKEVLNTMLRLPNKIDFVELAEGKCPMQFATEKLKADKALMVIMVVECDKGASIAVFPEDRVAVVNAKKITEGADEKDAKARMIREIWRAIGFISGTGYASSENDVMQPITSPLELDAIQWQVLNPSNGPKMDKFLKKYNVKRGHRTSYRKACEQGWAPAPTNDLQKAVWDEVKAAKGKPAAVPVPDAK